MATRTPADDNDSPHPKKRKRASLYCKHCDREGTVTVKCRNLPSTAIVSSFLITHPRLIPGNRLTSQDVNTSTAGNLRLQPQKPSPNGRNHLMVVMVHSLIRTPINNMACGI